MLEFGKLKSAAAAARQAERITGLPAPIALAQWAVETQWGIKSQTTILEIAERLTEDPAYGSTWNTYVKKRDTLAYVRAMSAIYTDDPKHSQRVNSILGMPEVKNALA